MASLIQYRHFFSTRIFHEYYLPRESALYNGLTEEQRNTIFHRQEKYYDISSDFDIVPTRECAELLKNFKLIFKQDNYGFFVACKVRKLDDEHLLIHEFGTMSSLDRHRLLISMDQISRIDAEAQYEKDIVFLGNYPR